MMLSQFGGEINKLIDGRDARELYCAVSNTLMNKVTVNFNRLRSFMKHLTEG